MWHYTEGVKNWDPIWPNHGIRILPGPSSLWLDANGRRLPAPCLPGFDTLTTLREILSTGHDYSWFVLSQKVIEKEFALSGSEQNPDLTSEELIEYIPGPDFPTGGIMLGRSGARKAYLEGRGSVIMRAKTRVEEIRKDRFAIVIDEICYQVNKSTMIEKIAEQVREKKIDGIAHVQDESDRNGVRVVIELKRDATAEGVMNQLYRFTPMQTYFGCNMLALNGGRPEQLTLRKFLTSFIDFREDVVARRTAYLLRKARERSHILCGLAVAVTNIDEVVATIRSSADAAEAREKLMTRRWPAEQILQYIALIDDPTHTANDDGTYNLSEAQARAILELRLQRLTQIGVKEVTDELEELAKKIKEYLEILGSRERIMGIISDELAEVKDQFAVPRRTEIVDWSGDMDDEDLIAREDMVVTVTSGGYIKRTPLVDFRSQRRGGKGVSGMQTKEEDVVTTLFVANTHTQLLFFTTDGMVYKLKTWRLPLGGRTSRGKAIVNILPIPTGVGIAAIMPVDRDEAGRPFEIWPLRPDRVKLIPHPEEYIKGYLYTGRDGARVALAADEVITLVVQVNGRLRDRVQVPASVTEEEAKKLALESAQVQRHISGKDVTRVIYVPGKLVNIVAG